MMDISDGLMSDLTKLTTASNCSAELLTDRLPLSKAFLKSCAQQRWNSTKLALSGGEEYILLCTIAAKQYKKIREKYKMKFGFNLCAIGKITDQSQHKIYYLNKNNQKQKVYIQPFDHFKRPQIKDNYEAT